MDKRKSESSTLGKRVIKIFVLGIQAISVLLLLVCYGSSNIFAADGTGTISITSPANGARITSSNFDVIVTYSASYDDAAIELEAGSDENADYDYASGWIPLTNRSGKHTFPVNLSFQPAGKYILIARLLSESHFNPNPTFSGSRSETPVAYDTVTINYDPQPTINPTNDLTPQTGGIYILSNPQGALIFLNPDAADGYSGTRTTPDERLGLRPGNYTVTLKKAGYPDTSKQAQIKAGNITTIEISLGQNEPDVDPIGVIAGVAGAAAVIGLVGKMITGKKPMPVRTPVRTPVIPRPPTKPAVPRPPNILRDEWAKQAEQQKKLREELMKARGKAEADKKAKEKKWKDQADTEFRLHEFESSLELEARGLLNSGYWIKNLYNSKITTIMGMGVDYLRDKGLTCGDIVEKEHAKVKTMALNKFGDGTIVDQVVIEEKTGALGGNPFYNHTAIRVILPNGNAYIVDFWQALQKGHIFEPEAVWRKYWQNKIVGLDTYTIQAGDSVELQKGFNDFSKNYEYKPKAIEEFVQAQRKIIDKSPKSFTDKQDQLNQLDTFKKYLGNQ